MYRQVGSRYFVSGANTVLRKEAAVHFLEYSGKDSGNKLERNLLGKSLDPTEIAQLKSDGLIYYHVYADLVMSKSNDLKNSALDMTQHYLELQTFLQEVEHNPEVVLDKDYKVFRSEEKLYGGNQRVNQLTIIVFIYSHKLSIRSCLLRVSVTLHSCIQGYLLEL